MKSPYNVGIQPVISFISFTIIGIALAVTVLQNSLWRVPVILLGMIIGGTLAYLDLKRMIKVSKGQSSQPVVSKENAKIKLAKHVAELFEENIPFEEEN